MGGAVTPSSVIGSVVIPAHNEALVIRRCLDTLLADFAPGELAVVVSCNGCTDDTADIVRSSWPAVRVIEVAHASKAAALRAADEVLTVFPRLYLDADVILPSASARLVIECLRNGPALAARPPISYDAKGSAPLVRSYYHARAAVPSVMNSLWGAGVYGLSAAGRERFGSFPDLIGDDLFVDQQFDRSEIEIVQAAPVVVRAPRRTRDLFRILRRAYQGNAENRTLPDGRGSTTQSTARGLLSAAVSRPGIAVAAATYLAIAVAARLTLRLSPPANWGRDESSREGAD
jgi:Glycosyl transferase family 2